MMEAEGSPFHSVNSESGYTVDELDGDSASRAADDWLSLPHRLSHSEPEPFPKGFLQNDSGCPLQGVNFQVCIRGEEKDMDVWIIPSCLPDFGQNRLPFWIISSPSPGQHQLNVVV